jgi:hypothetical protein
MTETRIRWEDCRGSLDAIASRGFVGALKHRPFIIYRPTYDDGQYRLLCLIGNRDGESLSADDPDELKATAERWLAEFVASLGAVFPEPVTTERASWPSADELAEMSMHDQEMWERRCADAEAADQETAVTASRDADVAL